MICTPRSGRRMLLPQTKFRRYRVSSARGLTRGIIYVPLSGVVRTRAYLAASCYVVGVVVLVAGAAWPVSLDSRAASQSMPAIRIVLDPREPIESRQHFFGTVSSASSESAPSLRIFTSPSTDLTVRRIYLAAGWYPGLICCPDQRTPISRVQMHRPRRSEERR